MLIIFSFLGHLVESIFFSSGNSGILFSFWTPIYGIGTITILFINKIINTLKINRFYKIITLFLGCLILLCTIEALGGYLLKWIFNNELWNYTSHKLNIGKYTSIEMGLIWGLSGLFLIYILKPFIDKFIHTIPKIITYFLCGLFIFDLIITALIKWF